MINNSKTQLYFLGKETPSPPPQPRTAQFPVATLGNGISCHLYICVSHISRKSVLGSGVQSTETRRSRWCPVNAETEQRGRFPAPHVPNLRAHRFLEHMSGVRRSVRMSHCIVPVSLLPVNRCWDKGPPALHGNPVQLGRLSQPISEVN